MVARAHNSTYSTSINTTYNYNHQPSQNNDNNVSMSRPPAPLGQHRMTSAERDMYRNESCQYCGVMNHTANICWYLPKQSVKFRKHMAAFTLDNSVIDCEWTSHTGASNHLTGNAVMFKNLRPYFCRTLQLVQPKIRTLGLLKFCIHLSLNEWFEVLHPLV